MLPIVRPSKPCRPRKTKYGIIALTFAHAAAFASVEKANADAMTSLKVIRNQDTAVLLNTGDFWITSRDSFPVNPEFMANALSAVTSLKSNSRKISLQEVEPVPNAGLRRIEWTDSTGKTSRIVLMKTLFSDRFETDTTRWRYDTSSNGHVNFWIESEDSTIWRDADSEQPYLAEGTFGWASTRDVDWKDRALFKHFPWTDIRILSVDWRDSSGDDIHYVIERDAALTSRLREPNLVPLSKENTQRVLDRANQFAVDDFVAGHPAPTETGLDDPSIVVRLTLWNGQEHVIKAGKLEGNLRYVQHPSRAKIVMVLDKRFDSLRKTIPEITTPLQPDTTDLSAEPNEHPPHLAEPSGAE